MFSFGTASASSPDWRIWEVPAASPMLTGAGEARITRYTHHEIDGVTDTAGDYRLSVRFTNYWRVLAGSVCLREAQDGMTVLHAAGPGAFRLAIDLDARGSAACG